jgi:hypothetical protein
LVEGFFPSLSVLGTARLSVVIEQPTGTQSVQQQHLPKQRGSFHVRLHGERRADRVSL